MILCGMIVIFWYRRGHHQEVATSMREQVLEMNSLQANLQCISVIKILLNRLFLLEFFVLIGCHFCCLLGCDSQTFGRLAKLHYWQAPELNDKSRPAQLCHMMIMIFRNIDTFPIECTQIQAVMMTVLREPWSTDWLRSSTARWFYQKKLFKLASSENIQLLGDFIKRNYLNSHLLKIINCSVISSKETI